MKFTAIAVVPCDDQEHRLGLTSSGRLVALDHNMRRERHRAELGGALPYCMRLIDYAFNTGDPAAILPAPFRDHANAAMARREVRRGRLSRIWDGLGTRQRMEVWFRMVAWKALTSCPYRWLHPPGDFDFHLYRVYSVGDILPVPSLIWQQDGNYSLNLLLPWRWWRTVHLAGLATVCLDIGYGRRLYFVQDNLTPGSFTPLLRLVDQNVGNGSWQTRRVQIRLADRSLIRFQPPEVGSLAKPSYRDQPWVEP